MNNHISDLVNTVIMIATPVDKPVLNIDVYFEALYRNVDHYWQQHKTISDQITNTTNTCCAPTKTSIQPTNGLKKLDQLVLITIGGGSRDLMIHAGLTNSKFSDVHAMVLLLF